MRSKFAVAALGVALVAAASRAVANPVGVPPTAKPFDVIEGNKISIELGTPTAHGWYVLIWGSAIVRRHAPVSTQAIDISISALLLCAIVRRCAPYYIKHGFDRARIPQ